MLCKSNDVKVAGICFEKCSSTETTINGMCYSNCKRY